MGQKGFSTKGISIASSSILDAKQPVDESSFCFLHSTVIIC